MDPSPADSNLLNALNLVPNPKPSTEVTSEVTSSTETPAVNEPEKVEQSENSLSSEQVSLLLQKVFTKDRLKAILLQEEEEDQSKVQNLQQDLEDAKINLEQHAEIKEALQVKLSEVEEKIKGKSKSVHTLRCELRELETKEEHLKKKKDACDIVAGNIKKRIRSCKYLLEHLPALKKKPLLQYTSTDLENMLKDIDEGKIQAEKSEDMSNKEDSQN